MQQHFTIQAPAKVNLCLSVAYPPDASGYHQLQSVFHELSLHDELEFAVCGIDECADDPRCACTAGGTLVALDCGAIDLPTNENLIFKAVDAIERAYGRLIVETDEGLIIRVEKHIPAGGGLGGGSSDAAAAIKACLALMGEELGEKAHEVARGLGADVAFFLYGGTCLMDGRGDTLVRRLPAFPLHIVLMGESEGISTARIYRDFDAAPPAAPDAGRLARLIEEFPPSMATHDQACELAAACANNLQPAAFEALPRLRERVQRAQEDEDVLNALVTGSGATSYAICASAAAALRFEQRAAEYCSWTARV